MSTPTTTVKLPRKHAQDWVWRCGWEGDEEIGKEVAVTARTITLELTDTGLTDLVSDCRYYISEMHGENTGGDDYASAAARCLNSLVRQGLTT